MDRVILVGEPANVNGSSGGFESIERYEYFQGLYNALPHGYNGDEAGNFMFMDGHVMTYSRTAMKNWADQYYVSSWGGPASNSNFGDPYPFELPGAY